MDRLAFIAIMGGSILVAPLVSEAQQSVKVYRVGVLSPGTPPLGRLDALRQGLRELGYEEGRTISIEWRFPGASDERLSNWTRHAGRTAPRLQRRSLTRGREMRTWVRDDYGNSKLVLQPVLPLVKLIRPDVASDKGRLLPHDPPTPF
jgi:hypothetical protein